MIRTSSMPHGYPVQDPMMRFGFQQGFALSPYSAVQGRRHAPLQQGLHGGQMQQQFAQRGMYQPAMGAGLNLASFLTKLAFAGGMK